eukprot:231598-Pelagomonas_calceolata.AAC.4
MTSLTQMFLWSKAGWRVSVESLERLCSSVPLGAPTRLDGLLGWTVARPAASESGFLIRMNARAAWNLQGMLDLVIKGSSAAKTLTRGPQTQV